MIHLVNTHSYAIQTKYTNAPSLRKISSKNWHAINKTYSFDHYFINFIWLPGVIGESENQRTSIITQPKKYTNMRTKSRKKISACGLICSSRLAKLNKNSAFLLDSKWILAEVTKTQLFFWIVNELVKSSMVSMSFTFELIQTNIIFFPFSAKYHWIFSLDDP